MKARARLGPFTDSKGVGRWGMELVDIPDHRDHTDGASAIELLELHPREEHNNEDDTGDIASQASLLGNFEWEARTISARHSNLTLDELQETVYASGEEERDLLRGIRDN